MSLSLAPRSCWSFLDPPPDAFFAIRVGVPGDWSGTGLFVILILLHDRFLLSKKFLKDQYLLAIFNSRYSTIFEGIINTLDSLSENINYFGPNFQSFAWKPQVCDHHLKAMQQYFHVVLFVFQYFAK